MNRLRLILLVLLILIVGSGDAPALGRRRRMNYVAPVTGAPAAESRSAAIQKLYDLRVDAAQQQYDFVLQRYSGGALSSESLFKAQRLLAEATYEAATTAEGRLRALEFGVKVATSDYDQVAARFQGGAASALDKVGARYALLTAEIRLAEEKERQAAGK